VAETLIGLLRGINVGPAKRVAMADLRALVEDLGYGEVRTLLNSGNVVFTAADAAPAGRRAAADVAAEAAARIEAGLSERLVVSARVTVITANELAAAIAGNPLIPVARDPSRLLVAVLADPADLPRLEPLAERDWSPEAFAIGPRVAYLWCPDGVIASLLAKALGDVLGDAVTSRNWTTMKKLAALAGLSPAGVDAPGS
jgi:uncharacterized protein (DUF1697 family)